MRRVAIFIAITALLAAPIAVFAAEPFSATLTPGAEVPAPTVPSDYSGSGSASATISDDETMIEVEITCQGLTGDLTGAHIHYGPVGEPGPVMFPFDHTGGCPMMQTLTEDDFMAVDGGPQSFDEGLQAIRNGMTYVNLHTEQNAPGEIRGQLQSLPDTATEESAPIAAYSGYLLLFLAAAATLVLGMRYFARRLA